MPGSQLSAHWYGRELEVSHVILMRLYGSHTCIHACFITFFYSQYHLASFPVPGSPSSANAHIMTFDPVVIAISTGSKVILHALTEEREPGNEAKYH